MNYYDAHTHLNDDKLFPEWQTYVNNFEEIGGKALVNVAVNEESYIRALEICQQNVSAVKTYATIGFHPTEVAFGHLAVQDISGTQQKLMQAYAEFEEYIVAVGETGIDLYHPGTKTTGKEQKILFGLECEIARHFKLPVVIHSRSAFEETFDVLQNFKDLKIYFHCRGYGPEEMKKLADTFPQLWFGFCGNTTFPPATQLRESLKNAYDNNFNILFETDAPYLAPQNVRGTMNNPSNVGFIYKFAGEFLGIDMNTLCTKIENNFVALYGKN